MNRDFNYTDLIEDYLIGNLSDAERLDFESQLNSDPLLNKEFQFQKDVINSIRDVRKAELKSMLDNVQVGSGGGAGLLSLKFAAGLIGVALLGIGVYFYMHQYDNQGTTDTEIHSDSTGENANLKESVTTDAPNSTAEITDEVQNLEKTAGQKNGLGESTIGKKGQVTTIIEKEPIYIRDGQPALSTPDHKNAEDENQPKAVERKEKDAFHYQFNNNKLSLYGDFKGIPYEIITLQQDSAKKLFMFYNNKYYYLDQNQKTIKPFKQVEDATLIKQLQELTKK